MSLAESGDSEAQWEAGCFFEQGLTNPEGSIIVRQNLRKAVCWYRRSSEAGYAPAQINLGNCLSTGRGARRDDAEAMRWYRRAVACGDGDALVEVGRRLYSGIGVRADAVAARRIFHRAIASSSITEDYRERAMFLLGVAYDEGQGVRRSLSQAHKWLSLSNRDGDRPDAQQLIQRIENEKRRTRRSARAAEAPSRMPRIIGRWIHRQCPVWAPVGKFVRP